MASCMWIRNLPTVLTLELVVDEIAAAGDVEMHLANCFDLFSEITAFVGHLNRVVRNFVQQLASLYSNSKVKQISC